MTWVRTQALEVIRRDRVILTDVNLAFPAMEAVAIIGPNGAGKSTLVRCLAGVIKPSAGTISLDGRNLHSMGSPQRANLIGYMPQQFAPHWDMPVSELLRIAIERTGRMVSDLEIDAALAENQLSPLSRRFWSTLSGGERARVALAMALATKPALLLADEPAASLDVQHKVAVTDRLIALSKRSLVVVVVHDLDIALNRFDSAIVMSKGFVVAHRSCRDLRHDPVLDEAFGVTFRRISDGNDVLLRPQRP